MVDSFVGSHFSCTSGLLRVAGRLLRRLVAPELITSVFGSQSRSVAYRPAPLKPGEDWPDLFGSYREMAERNGVKSAGVP